VPKLTNNDPEIGDEAERAGRRPTSGTPRWVKIIGVIALVLALAVIVMLILGGGEHGPGRHTGSQPAGAVETEGHTPPQGGHE
jgi:hypothetical protein